MSEALGLVGSAWILTQFLSMAMLELGTRWAGHPRLVRFGRFAHQRKLQALETVWPLTRLRAAAERGAAAPCTVILSSLIVAKSLGCFVFGIVVVFWLPVASLVVPTVVAIHDPDDPTLVSWVRRVAALQVTSHAIAGALGFGLAIVGPLDGVSVSTTLSEHAPLAATGLAASFAFAVAAGRLEASRVVARGI